MRRVNIPLVDKLLAVEWSHALDFQLGLYALYEIKETLEVLGSTIKAMKEGCLEDAVRLVMCSPALINCLMILSPDCLRNVMKMTFKPQSVQDAVQRAMKQMPAEMQHLFEDILAFANELDDGDLTILVQDFAALVNNFKVQIPKGLKKMQSGVLAFDFPGDILKSIDPVDILSELAQAVPTPFDQAYSKALELAPYAPLLKVVACMEKCTWCCCAGGIDDRCAAAGVEVRCGAPAHSSEKGVAEAGSARCCRGGQVQNAHARTPRAFPETPSLFSESRRSPRGYAFRGGGGFWVLQEEC